MRFAPAFHRYVLLALAVFLGCVLWTPVGLSGAAGQGALVASNGPVFGPLDLGGMPVCLVELAPHVRTPGYVVNAQTTYVVWAAPKQNNQPYTRARWSPYGPRLTEPKTRYLFEWLGVSAGGRIRLHEPLTMTTTILSPGLASFDFDNQSPEPVWIIINPLPPGCGGRGGEGSEAIPGSGGGGGGGTTGGARTDRHPASPAPAQAWQMVADFPYKPGNEEPSPPVSKDFSISGPGMLVVRTLRSPNVPFDHTYNDGRIGFRGKASDYAPFPDALCFKHYQGGREVSGSQLSGDADALDVRVIELPKTTIADAYEVRPSVERHLNWDRKFQNRWRVTIQMAVYPLGTDVAALCVPTAPASPAPATRTASEPTSDSREIVSYPKIKEFTGDYRYRARYDGVELTRNSDGERVFVAAGNTHELAERFRHVLANDAGLARQLADALSDDVAVFDGALRVQVFRGGALIHEVASRVIWISRHGPR